MRFFQYRIANLLVLMVVVAFAASGYARGGSGAAFFSLASYTTIGLGAWYLYRAFKDRDLKYLWGSVFLLAGLIGLWAIFFTV